MLATLIGLGLPLVLAGGAVAGARLNARDQEQRRNVWRALEALRVPDPPLHDPADVESMPEVAQRYFDRAIAPGTPLHRVVRLRMTGKFIMNGKHLPMSARQILAPPADGFVWQAEIGKGLMRFAGSDGYHAPAGGPVTSWTKFWLHGLVPLARIGGGPDHARAAAMRAMLESVWAPASLPPQSGADWRQTGPHSAEIRHAGAPDLAPVHLRIDDAGNPVEVWAMRWTNANPGRIWRLQPFGGHVLECSRFGGFTLPSRVEMGNMYGTTDYEPFFLATVTDVET